MTTPNLRDPAKPLTDQQIFKVVPGGIIDSLLDPWDCDIGDGDESRSIKSDIVRIARAIEKAHGIGDGNSQGAKG